MAFFEKESGHLRCIASGIMTLKNPQSAHGVVPVLTRRIFLLTLSVNLAQTRMKTGNKKIKVVILPLRKIYLNLQHHPISGNYIFRRLNS
ncbi:hypothetical protein [Desulfotruncus arcticus]|uniref:hypothetical protein n=1 Tax=Desulfotruncus arcticus TaxID=341036 RepID=UPI0010420CB2|nr:hypothetical protein [Desulfotruncus arcticus]